MDPPQSPPSFGPKPQPLPTDSNVSVEIPSPTAHNAALKTNKPFHKLESMHPRSGAEMPHDPIALEKPQLRSPPKVNKTNAKSPKKSMPPPKGLGGKKVADEIASSQSPKFTEKGKSVTKGAPPKPMSKLIDREAGKKAADAIKKVVKAPKVGGKGGVSSAVNKTPLRPGVKKPKTAAAKDTDDVASPKKIIKMSLPRSPPAATQEKVSTDGVIKAKPSPKLIPKAATLKQPEPSAGLLPPDEPIQPSKSPQDVGQRIIEKENLSRSVPGGDSLSEESSSSSEAKAEKQADKTLNVKGEKSSEDDSSSGVEQRHQISNTPPPVEPKASTSSLRPLMSYNLPETSQIVRDVEVLNELRAIVFDRKEVSRVLRDTNIISVRVTGRKVVEKVEIVKEWLPEVMKQQENDPAEIIKLLYHILPHAVEDPQIPGMISTVHERTGDLRKAYLWAFHAYALNRNDDHRRRVQLLAERLLSNQIKLRDGTYGINMLPGAAKARAMQSPYPIELLVGNKHPKRPLDWLGSEAKPFQMESKSPFRMLSTERILPGTLLLEEAPLAISPSFDEKESLQLGTTCFFCLEQLNLMETGFMCPVMPRTCPFKFCSLNCFTRNALMHKYSCAFVHCQLFPLAHTSGMDPAFILLLVRLLLKTYLARFAADNDYIYIDRKDPLAEVARLTSYEAETRRLRPELWRCISTLASLLKHTFPIVNKMGMTTRDLEDLICRLHTHAIPVVHRAASGTLQGRPTIIASGIVLCGELSNFSHSCIPNCFASYDPKVGMRLQSIATIRPRSNLCFSMIADLYVPQAARKTLSASMKVIDCICGRCRDPGEGNRFVSAIRCENCVFGFRCPRRSARTTALMLRQSHIDPIGGLGNPIFLVQWECTDCGPVRFDESRRCSVKIGRWHQRYSDLIKKFQPLTESKEDLTVVRSQLEELFEELFIEAHPFNWLLFQTAATLAGTWQREPAKNFTNALDYLRIAEVAARAVLPLAWPEVMDLANVRATLSSHVICDLKRKSEATANIDRALAEPLWRAVWNAFCCFGRGSPQWLYCVTQLRKYLALNIETSEAILHKTVRGHITNGRLLTQISTRLWASAGVPSRDELEERLKRDPTVWWFTACRLGDVFTVRTHLASGSIRSDPELWLSAIDGRTGFPAVGVAALSGQYSLYKFLLARSHLRELLHRNEWGLSIPLAVCAKRIGSGAAETSAKQQDRLHAKIVCDFFERLRVVERDDTATDETSHRLEDLLGRQSRNKDINEAIMPVLPRKVMALSSNPLVGAFQAIHYAAARGKQATVRELLKIGADIHARNAEVATPLHLAVLSGNDRTVRTLLLAKADVEATNYRGETPFMLACYALKLTTCNVLLAAGAVVDHISPYTGANCLHALAAGVTRTFRVAFGGRLRKDDPMDVHLGGFNPASIHHLYEPYSKPNAFPSYASIPVIEALSDDLLLFPDEMERRLTAAIAIAERIRAHINLERPPPSLSTTPEDILVRTPTARIQPEDDKEQIFEHTCREGYRPVELLWDQWELMKACRQNVTLGDSDIRFSGTSEEERAESINNWISNVMEKVEKLKQVLKPAKEGEPVSLHLRQSTELGHRTVADERPAHWGVDEDGHLIDQDLSRILPDPDKGWAAKSLTFITPQEKLVRDARKMVEGSIRAKAAEVLKKAADLKRKDAQQDGTPAKTSGSPPTKVPPSAGAPKAPPSSTAKAKGAPSTKPPPAPAVKPKGVPPAASVTKSPSPAPQAKSAPVATKPPPPKKAPAGPDIGSKGVVSTKPAATPKGPPTPPAKTLPHSQVPSAGPIKAEAPSPPSVTEANARKGAPQVQPTQPRQLGSGLSPTDPTALVTEQTPRKEVVKAPSPTLAPSNSIVDQPSASKVMGKAVVSPRREERATKTNNAGNIAIDRKEGREKTESAEADRVQIGPKRSGDAPTPVKEPLQPPSKVVGSPQLTDALAKSAGSDIKSGGPKNGGPKKVNPPPKNLIRPKPPPPKAKLNM